MPNRRLQSVFHMIYGRVHPEPPRAVYYEGRRRRRAPADPVQAEAYDYHRRTVMRALYGVSSTENFTDEHDRGEYGSNWLLTTSEDYVSEIFAMAYEDFRADHPGESGVTW